NPFDPLVDLLEMRPDCAAEKGKLDAVHVANEQRAAKLLFELLNAVAEGRLRDLASPCRAGEVSFAVDGKAIFDALYFHRRGAPTSTGAKSAKNREREHQATQREQKGDIKVVIDFKLTQGTQSSQRVHGSLLSV